MSGIFGVLMLDGSEPAPADLDAMQAQLERRGPDGSHRWSSGSVALGHTLLATTPEALVESLPLTDEHSGCTITADVRLDNRDELIPELGLESEKRVIGDGELILRAYLRWGDDCPKHLLGDFAFAIWDPRSQRLFCARDHMGMRQFNYCHLPGAAFVFATEDTAVLAHSSVPKQLDEGRIADFLADIECVDFTSSFFGSVKRLPPAHSLTAGAQGLHARHYWSLEPPPLLSLATDADYANAFLKVFTEAVRCRLRASGAVGTMLSGGLDSTMVTAVAAKAHASWSATPLTTISAVDDDSKYCAETQAIKSALGIEDLSPVFVYRSDLGHMIEPLIEALRVPRNPFELHATMLRCIYRTAKQSGINVLLDGGSGDVILLAPNRVAALLSQWRPLIAVRELVEQARVWAPEKPKRFLASNLISAAWVAFAPLKLRSHLRHIRVTGYLPKARRDFAGRVNFKQRRRLADLHRAPVKPLDPKWRVQAILHPDLVSGRERYEQLSASSGVEARDPFMDLRVIKLILSLPADQLESGGWRKIILRKILEKQVPAEVAWRRGKEHLGWDFTNTLLKSWPSWRDCMLDPASPLATYLSPAAMKGLRKRQLAPPTDMDLRLMALDHFLRRYGR